MYKNVEIRKLPSGLLCNLINILEINSDWKKFMSNIPRDINGLSSTNFEPKYNSEHISMIEDYAKESSLKCTEILLDEWATSGRVRPRLSDLKMIIDKSQVLYRAADELADILNESKPQRPGDGPAAPITTDVSILLNDSKLTTDNSNMQRFCGQSTQQMKSADPLIQFSLSSINSNDSIGNKTTVEIKSASDLIKFSSNNSGSQSYTKPMETSGNVPDFKAMEQESPNLNYENVYQQSFPNLDLSIDIDSAILHDTKLRDFEYQLLQSITNNFSDNIVEGPNGFKAGKIGSGGFGDVFVGTCPKFGLLAVKKVHSNLDIKRKPDIAMKVFNAEVKFLSHFRHTNILPILGYSIDGPVPCIVSEYIDGGSLSEKIQAKVLNIEHRMNIILGTAKGLKYLHTNETPIQSNAELLNLGRAIASDSDHSTTNFVHGDVKAANILLTKDYVPKLCDFGLAKQYDCTIMTTCPMGTSAYMAPEGLHGTITQKIDIYSFGIVLLEVLTGLKPIVVSNGEKLNIKDYVEENYKGDIKVLLDPDVQNWIEANDIYTLAQKCLERNRKDRPTMNEVCKTLFEIWDC
ncbi:interleukin-1 receptor-associated kinase 4-like [Pieris napi]|uniref:interleukin-1 receptor-associated kinase 4-like n=1 Tax=Pieris napi TaxID=78633 RepID=UPI001FB8E102|nr:interleukin-1 receptor-associated kinase 4-like [Pieris napi]